MAPAQDAVPVGGVPAGYGRSCTNCSRAKCRCVFRGDGDQCDRCHRLGKACQQMATSRRRVAKRTTASRTAQLEEKLDDLVSILKAAQQPPRPSMANALPPYPSQPPSSQPFLSRLDSLADAATTSQPQSHVFNIGHAISNSSSLSDTDRLPEPTPGEAEAYLAKFRRWLEFFPFMHLSPELTAESLRRERPFLWLCIMNITTMSVPQQHILKDRVRQEVAQRVVVNHERSMDILLGLIAYVAWALLNTGPGSKPFLTLYTQMAACIIYELGLSRFPNEEHYSSVCFKVWGGRPVPPVKDRTMEERRAVLSFWFLTSVCSSFLGKMDSLDWTPHMQESLGLLESENELPSDEVLVTLLKLQFIGEEARKLLTRDFLNRDMAGDAAQAPTYVFKKSMTAQLQVIRKGLSPGLASKYIIQAHILSTEAQVHAVGLFGRLRIPDRPRVDGMYAGLRAARAWYEVLFAFPATEIPGLPFTVYAELSQIHALLYRLTVAEDPVWDKDIVRNTADLLVYIDRTIELFLKVEALYPLRCENDDSSVFAKCAKILRNVRATWEPALSKAMGGIPTPNSQGLSSAAMQPALTVDYPIMTDQTAPADFNDFTWMTDVFGPWDL